MWRRVSFERICFEGSRVVGEDRVSQELVLLILLLIFTSKWNEMFLSCWGPGKVALQMRPEDVARGDHLMSSPLKLHSGKEERRLSLGVDVFGYVPIYFPCLI